MYALKVMTVTEKHYSKCSLFAFGFKARIKTILPLINHLINEALLVAHHASITCCFSSLTSLTAFWWTCSCVSVSVGVSRRWCNGVVFMQPGVKTESEWCILLWCLAAQTVASRHLSSCWRLLLSNAPRVHKSSELLRHKTMDFTPNMACQQTRPHLCRLQIVESHTGMHLWETSRDVKAIWWAVVINFLLTEWHITLHGRIETPVRRGGQLCCSFVANLLQYLCAKNYQNTMRFNWVVAKIEGCNFFAPQCSTLSALIRACSYATIWWMHMQCVEFVSVWPFCVVHCCQLFMCLLFASVSKVCRWYQLSNLKIISTWPSVLRLDRYVQLPVLPPPDR